MELNLAYSPCPNDTFVFSGIHSGALKLNNHNLFIHHHDIETLNRSALEGRFEITKMSFYTWLTLKGKYRLINAGNALGYGCGPVLLSKKKIDVRDLPSMKVVLPGEHTSAHLLYRLFCPESKNRYFTTYDKIFSSLHSGDADCGVVIHESRFLYEKEGLYLVKDLGEWWESVTGAPIPLGAIGIRSDMPETLDGHLEKLIRDSLIMSRKAPEFAMPYIRQMAIEMDDAVIQKHIKTFVNDFTLDLGDAGLKAIETMRQLAVSAGMV